MKRNNVKDEATAYQWAAQALRGMKCDHSEFETAMDRVAYALLEAARGERERWAYWIGTVLPQKEYMKRYNVALWGIAECMERNNYGVVAHVNAGAVTWERPA